MELKSYQTQVLQDLKAYLGYLNQYHNNAKAYALLWADKGVKVGGKEKMKPYRNLLPRVPHVCFKVPTGGGKTFLACASVKPIFGRPHHEQCESGGVAGAQRRYPVPDRPQPEKHGSSLPPQVSAAWFSQP